MASAKRPKPTFEEMKKALEYDRENGRFRWLISTNGHRVVGAVAGRRLKNGYWSVGYQNQPIQIARLVWLFETGDWPKSRLIYINKNPDDTRFENLRESMVVDVDYDRFTVDGNLRYEKEHRQVFREYHRGINLKRDFGISLVDYEKMLVDQNGLCAICEKPETAMRGGKLKRLAVDHDHETGELRGLLCGTCNPMLGYAKDNPGILRSALRYLDRAKPRNNVTPLRAVNKETA